MTSQQDSPDILAVACMVALMVAAIGGFWWWYIPLIVYIFLCR